jgi:hypothetical protein
MWTPEWRVTTPAFVVEGGVDLRELGQDLGQGADQERQHGEALLALVLGVELGAQALQLRHVDSST